MVPSNLDVEFVYLDRGGQATQVTQQGHKDSRLQASIISSAVLVGVHDASQGAFFNLPSKFLGLPSSHSKHPSTIYMGQS